MGSDIAYLVTGGNGQLGRALGRLLPDATIMDRKELDLTDPEAVSAAISKHRPDVVINAAAYTKVDAAEANPDDASAVNVEAPRNLVDAMKDAEGLLVHVSTDYVFPGDAEGAYMEDDPTGPLSVYGKTKLRGEEVVASYRPHLIVRTSWVFGDGHNFVRSILKAARSNPVLDVVDDQIGLPTYAPDLAGGIIAMISKGLTGLYHLPGGGEPTSWAGLARFAIASAGLDAVVNPVSTDQYFQGKAGPIAPRPSNSILDDARAAAEGVTLRDWREAVEDYVRTLDLEAL